MIWESALGPDSVLVEVILFCWGDRSEETMVSIISKLEGKACRIRILFVLARAKDYRIKEKGTRMGRERSTFPA